MNEPSNSAATSVDTLARVPSLRTATRGMAQTISAPAAVAGNTDPQRKTVAVCLALIVAIWGSLVTEVAQAAAESTVSEPTVQAIDMLNEQEVALRLIQARGFMDAKVSKLGLVAGPQFVDTVKKNSRLARTFLEQPDQPIPFTGLLGEIVQKYSLPLSQAKRYHPGLYRETVKFLDGAISIIETAPLSEVKPRLASLH